MLKRDRYWDNDKEDNYPLQPKSTVESNELTQISDDKLEDSPPYTGGYFFYIIHKFKIKFIV